MYLEFDFEDKKRTAMQYGNVTIYTSLNKREILNGLQYVSDFLLAKRPFSVSITNSEYEELCISAGKSKTIRIEYNIYDKKSNYIGSTVINMSKRRFLKSLEKI